MSTKYHVPDGGGTPRSDIERPGSASTVEFVRQKTSPTNHGLAVDTKALLSIPERSHQPSSPMGPYQSDASKFVNGTPSKAVAIHVRAESEPEEDRQHSMSSENKAQATAKTKPSTLMRRTSTLIAPPTLMPNVDVERHGTEEAPPGFLRPNTYWQFAWSYFIMVISIYNTFTIPYRMALWESPIRMDPDVILMLSLDAIGDVCFFIEMYRALRTGYVDNGVVIYDKKLIWKRYFASWFLLDLATCLPFDLIQLGFLRVIPTVRVVKILRIFQVLHHYNVIEENTTVSLQFRVGKLLFYTGVLSHWAACIKYHVILADHDYAESKIRVLEKSAFGRYLQAMYWSTGAMTGRDDTNPPENLVDAGFTVFMMVLGILWLAYIIASLETFAHDGNNSGARFQAKVGYVTQFMHQFHLPKDIQDKVKAYYSYLWSSSLRFETEHFLSTLPVTLQADLNLSMHRVLERASIFEFVDSGFLALIVQTLTTTVSIPGEIICHVDMAAHEMWFISEGEVEICIGPKLAAIAKLREGDHFGEYGIFGPQGTRTATARSVGYCTLLVVSASGLQKALNLFPNSDVAVRSYVEEHRNKTLLQERNFLGLGNTGGKAGKGGKQNEKLKKLITVDEHVQSSSFSGGWTISPQSKLYERWQMVYFAFMAWNGIVLPLRIGFLSTQVNPYVMTIDYLGDVFLILDIILNFRLRYIQGGSEISDIREIRSKYMRGWFVPHVLASIPLDVIMISIGMEPLCRLNRILRLAHVHVEILAKLKDATHYNLLSLLYLFFNFLFLSHWAASIYYSFTRFEGFQPDTALGHPDFAAWRPSKYHESHPSLIYQYLQSQYYAMSLLAGIGRHLYPPSNYDVCLSLFVMLTGVFVVSYLIGKVGHLIFNLNASAAEFKAEAAFVSQLLDYRKVSPEVTQRVTEYMKHVWTSQKGIDPNVAIRGLPMAIRTDIMMYLFEDMIRKVPRFKDLDDNFVRQLVTELTFVELPAGEFVFRQGQIGDSMYFISKGLVEILFDAVPLQAGVDSPASQPHQLKIIGQGSFFGEGALFAGTRAASIRTRTPVRLLALSETSFQRVMHVHPHFAEKIMFLNQQRQKKMEQKVVASLIHTPGHGPHASADLARQGSKPRPSQAHLSPRPAAGPDAISPRGKASQQNPRKSIMIQDRPILHVGQNTGLGAKVERLLQKEKEKEESRRSNSTPGTPVRAMVTASAMASPGVASAAATSSHPVSAPQWSAGNPPTLTITTTHTIALHDGHASGGLGASSSLHEVHNHPGAHGSTHIISDIEINRGSSSAAVAAGARGSPSQSPALHPAPVGPIPDQERSVHAGVPPGFTDEEPLASPSMNRPADAGVVVLNPTRSSYNPNNPPPSSAARDRRMQAVHQSASSISPSMSASTPDSPSANGETVHHAEVGGIPYPSSSIPQSHDPSILAFPRDPAAALVGTAPPSAVDDQGPPSGGLGGHMSQPSTSSLGGIGTKNNLNNGRMSAQRR
jgi:CRP-like cAMP-binding protein